MQPDTARCWAGRSKRRRWNDNCTGRMCSAKPAIPLEPPASSKEASAKARQMEKKRKNADREKLRRAKVQAASGQDADRERRALAAEEALSKLTAGDLWRRHRLVCTRVACPLLSRYRLLHTYCPLSHLPPTHLLLLGAPILQWHFQVRWRARLLPLHMRLAPILQQVHRAAQPAQS